MLKKKYSKYYITLSSQLILYGEGDNFDLNSSHVLPALVKKVCILAKKKKLKTVEIWGSGTVTQRIFKCF